VWQQHGKYAGWRVHFERRTRDSGRTWERIGPIHDGRTFGAIQPTLLTRTDGSILALCRNQNGDGFIRATLLCRRRQNMD
jgi:predicted neuraminidase